MYSRCAIRVLFSTFSRQTLFAWLNRVGEIDSRIPEIKNVLYMQRLKSNFPSPRVTLVWRCNTQLYEFTNDRYNDKEDRSNLTVNFGKKTNRDLDDTRIYSGEFEQLSNFRISVILRNRFTINTRVIYRSNRFLPHCILLLHLTSTFIHTFESVLRHRYR